MHLEGAAVLVTGAAQGIGRAIAEALLSKKAKVCIGDLQIEEKEIEELKQTYGKENVIFHKFDVSAEDQFEEAILETKKHFGYLDIICNNAGISNEKHPKRVLEVNLIGVLNGITLAHKHLVNSKGIKGGTVINTASILGIMPSYGLPAYSASKAAVVALTVTWGHELNVKLTNVKVNAVCPSYILTKLLAASNHRSLHDDKLKAITEENKAYWGDPKDVAQGVIKILHDDVSSKLLVVSVKDGTYYHDWGTKDFFE